MGPLLQRLLGWLGVPSAPPIPAPGPSDSGQPVIEPVDRPSPAAPGPRGSRLGDVARDYEAWKACVLLLAGGRAPEGLAAGHSLSLAKLRIRSLPAGLTVRGDLDLRQCQRLTRIGDGLCVSGDLRVGGRCPEPPWWERKWLREAETSHTPAMALRTLSGDDQCPLAALPSELRIGGDLRLRKLRRLERLPEGLFVGRSIELAGCTSLARLPDPFEVHGDLTIQSAPSLAALPDRLVVKGNLRVIGAHIESLPGHLTVGEDLVLECCDRLTTLPDGLAVGGSLVVRRCPIGRIPEGLRVGRDLRLHRLPELRETPPGLSAPGRIELLRCPTLRRIGPGLRVGTDLCIRRCGRLEELPEGLVVPGTLDLRGSATLTKLPRGLDVGAAPGRSAFEPALRVADCPALTSLPGDLELAGPIEVAGSGLRDLPERLSRSTRILWRGVLVPPEVVFRPETLTPEQILGQPNAELRRVMLERVGLEVVLRRARAEVLDRDADAGGERRLVLTWLRDRPGQAQPRCYLHCRCPSTGREYLLRVPPETRTCREAAAWLAGFDDPDGYRPVRET
ncbi:hypothetical protein OJF2_73910 [Aquisphaera giovannonii]|uniref:DUF6745 domain-containing protein n=1 Tax=Aquisphaera giovannonii TaxID=406548 RepID=A0A5B9WE90_9BACT|nr:hypothetical protein [Aquisphaera giovannonii]QEH38783.1 hypothetical protein OJF2_73910 [Aquisphaera giovannonii]